MNESDDACEDRRHQAQQPQPNLAPSNDRGFGDKTDMSKLGGDISGASDDEEQSALIDVARQNAKIQGLYKELLDEPLPGSISALVEKLKNKENSK